MKTNHYALYTSLLDLAIFVFLPMNQYLPVFDFSSPANDDVVVKSPLGVMPVPDHVRDDGSGIYNRMNLRDSGLRRNDTAKGNRTFYELVNDGIHISMVATL